jgi:hypothetical protein
VFEAVNFERLLIKVAIFHIRGKKSELKLRRYDTDRIDLRRHILIGESQFRLYDIVRNKRYETKALFNHNPLQKSVAEDLKLKQSTVNIRFNEIEQTTANVQIVIGIRDYDNGKSKSSNLKTITNMFYIVSRQRELGEFVPVYTSETRKYDYEKAKLNFAKQEVMLKDFCRNEEQTQLKFELYEFKEELLKPGQKTQQQLEDEKLEK